MIKWNNINNFYIFCKYIISAIFRFLTLYKENKTKQQQNSVTYVCDIIIEMYLLFYIYTLLDIANHKCIRYIIYMK